MTNGGFNGYPPTAQYLALTAPRWFPARAFSAVDGAPAASVVTGTSVTSFSYADGANGSAGTTFLLPTTLTKADIQVLWAQSGTAAGAFRMRCDYGMVVEGGVTATTTGTATSVTVPGVAAQITSTTLESNVTVTAGGLFFLKIWRLGPDGADTCTDVMHMAGVRIIPHA